MPNALVFLTVEPNKYLIELALEIVSDELAIFIAIDNSNYDSKTLPSNITPIQYDNAVCQSEGYIGSLLEVTLKNTFRPGSVDKALYHFCIKDLSYENIYLVEDDVFISDKNIFRNLDKNYKNADLLCPSNISQEDDPKWYHWRLFNKMEKPWYHSLTCACRLSKRLLAHIATYAKINKRLSFHEFLFNTLAKNNNLTIQNPEEFKNIYWQHKWDLSELVKGNLYHPLKAMQLHQTYRTHLDNIIIPASYKQKSKNTHGSFFRKICKINQ